MNLKYILIVTISIVTMFSACTVSTPDSYTITGLLPDSANNGKEIVIKDLLSREVISTSVIDGNTFKFEGVSDTAKLCNIQVKDSKLYGIFILENGNISIDLSSPKKAFSPSGTQNNDVMSQISGICDTISDVNIKTESQKWFEKHNNDIIGLLLFCSDLYVRLEDDAKLATIEGFGSYLKEQKSVKEAYGKLKAKKTTAVGQQYTDIKGTDINGNKIALSDFVGKGNYVLVDMWASWCTPCKMEIPNIAEVYNLYKDKGLTVLGIFVWDEVQNLEPTMKTENVTWPQMIDSEKSATKTYGVDGIPAIMLIGPDGTILERGMEMRGENIKKNIEKYLSVD